MFKFDVEKTQNPNEDIIRFHLFNKELDPFKAPIIKKYTLGNYDGELNDFTASLKRELKKIRNTNVIFETTQ